MQCSLYSQLYLSIVSVVSSFDLVYVSNVSTFLQCTSYVNIDPCYDARCHSKLNMIFDRLVGLGFSCHFVAT